MNKNAAPGEGGRRDADGHELRSLHPPTFAVTAFDRVAYGSKIVEASVEVAGVGEFLVDVFAPSGKPPFCLPRSIRAKYSGGWTRTFKLDQNFLEEILAALLARLDADGGSV